jgi:hypothetical protein
MQEIEEYFNLRQQRLAVQREADKLEQQEKDLLYSIQTQMSAKKVGTTTYRGYTASIESKPSPVVKDWTLTLDYIRSTGELDMLQKRLTESAVKARWDAGVDIPGVEKGSKYVVTVTKD